MPNGLDDVVAAETVLSDVDGAAGTLIIRGHPLAGLAGRIPYEGAIGLLLDGFFEELPRADRLSPPPREARPDLSQRGRPVLPALPGLAASVRPRARLAPMP